MTTATFDQLPMILNGFVQYYWSAINCEGELTYDENKSLLHDLILRVQFFTMNCLSYLLSSSETFSMLATPGHHNLWHSSPRYSLTAEDHCPSIVLSSQAMHHIVAGIIYNQSTL